MFSQREQMIAERRNYLGGTDVAALVGRNKYASPMSVYADKVLGQVERDPEDMEAAEAGLALEPLIKTWSERDCAWVVKESQTYYHPVHKFLAVNPDGEIGSDELLEAKSYSFRTSGEWGEEGTDQIPDAYHVQCIWQLGITGKKRVRVVALDRGTLSRKYYHVDADPQYYEALVAIAVDFWNNNILTKTPPEPIGHSSDTEAIKRIYPHDMPVFEPSDEEADKIATVLLEARKTREHWEELEDGYKVRLQAKIGDSEGIVTSEGTFTWKAPKEGVKTDWKALCATLMQDVSGDVRDTLISQHSKPSKGSRRFNFPKE